MRPLQSRGFIALGALGLAVAATLAIRLRAHPPAPPPLPPPAATAEPSAAGRVVQAGVAVDLAIDQVDPDKRTKPLREGQDITVRFTITDAQSGAPFPRTYPAAWIVPHGARDADGLEACKAKVRDLLGGSSLGAAPKAVDLTTYYVLVMNADATISVIDPRFGFGGSKLLSMVFLPSPPADWALLDNQSRLFVSMPDKGSVAVVDPASFTVREEIAAAPRPARIALQPDEGYLWILSGEGAPVEGSAATVVSPLDLRIAARILLSAGPHAIAFSDDGRTAFITNQGAGTVSIVDVRKLEVVKEVPAGRALGAIAFSRASKLAYVTDAASGTIAVIDGARREVTATIPSGPGVAGIAFEKSGRFGFTWNPELNKVDVVDAAGNRVIQSGGVLKGPDRITFSDTLAYIRHRGSETIMMIPLQGVGTPGAPLSLADFPAGQLAPGSAVIADPVVQAAGDAAVLVANAADKTIYYYKEGMAAPMGHFAAYGHVPEAVMVLDRTLRERSPGVYETVARLRGPGRHDVAFLLDNPRVVHCFGIDVAEALDKPNAPALPGVEWLVTPTPVPVGKPVRLRVRLTAAGSKAPVDGLADVQILANLAPGVWHDRLAAAPAGDGAYAVDFEPPQPGMYALSVEAPSLGVTINSAPAAALAAVAPKGP